MYRLMIVDDEAEIRNGYARFFPWEQLGFEVAACAEDGEEALDLLGQTPVHLVMCDLVMPKLDGFGFIREVNHLYPDILLIVLSGYDSFEYARSLIELQVFRYVLKSDRHNVLIDVLRQAKKQLDNRSNSGEHEYVAAARRYIHENLASVTLAEAASHVHISASHLSRVFKEETGLNFYAYVLEQRMEQACELLADSGEKIYQIAHGLGYSEVKNFNRVFKQRRGMTPKEYRQRHSGGDSL